MKNRFLVLALTERKRAPPFRALVSILATVLLPAFGCADEESGPMEPALPRAEFVKIATFECPVDAASSEDCTQSAESELTVNHLYIQELHFVEADYLLGQMSWPFADAVSPCEVVERRCVLFGLWGPFDREHGIHRIGFRLEAVTEYEIRYSLMVLNHLLADTLLIFTAAADDSSGSATSQRRVKGGVEQSLWGDHE